MCCPNNNRLYHLDAMTGVYVYVYIECNNVLLLLFLLINFHLIWLCAVTRGGIVV